METCFCWSLRRGSLIIGILQLIGHILALIFCLTFVFVIFPYLDKTMGKQMEVQESEVQKERTLLLEGKEYDEELLHKQAILLSDFLKFREVQRLYTSFFTPVIVMCSLIGIAFAYILIRGVLTDSTRLIGMWTIYQIPAIVVSSVFSLAYYYCVGVSIRDILQLIYVFVLSPMFSIYCMMAVLSYLKELQTKRTMKPNV